MHTYTPRRSTTFPAMTAARSNPEACAMLEHQHRGMRAVNIRHVGALPNGASVYHAQMRPMGNPGGMPGLGAFAGATLARLVFQVPAYLILGSFMARTSVIVGNKITVSGGGVEYTAELKGLQPPPDSSLTESERAELAKEMEKEAAYAEHEKLLRAKRGARPWIAGSLGIGMSTLGAFLGARMAAAPEDARLAGRYAAIGSAAVGLMTMIFYAVTRGQPENSLGGAYGGAVGGYLAKGSGTIPTT